MAILLEDVAQGFDQHRIIIDQQDPQLPHDRLQQRACGAGYRERIGGGKAQPHGGAAPTALSMSRSAL